MREALPRRIQRRTIRHRRARKQKNPCEGRCCRHIAGVSEADAPVGVEPTMADLQSGAEGGICRGKPRFPKRCTRGCTHGLSRPGPRGGGRGMVESAPRGPGWHPRDSAGEPLSEGVAPRHCCGPPVPTGRRKCCRFGLRPCRFVTDMCRFVRAFSRFVLLWPPAACKWGGGYFASLRAVESSNWRLAHKAFHTEDFPTP